MKQEVTPAMWVALIVIAVLILGFIGWRAFGSNGASMDQATINSHIAAKKNKQDQ